MQISEAIGYNWPLLMPGAAFVGGVSDGQYGATAMEFGGRPPQKRKKGFELRRGSFMLDDAVVVLGAGLSRGPAAVVATTMANERRSGPVIIGGGGGGGGGGGAMPVLAGNHTYCKGKGACPTWLWHNGTGLVPLAGGANGSPIELNLTNRTGDFAALTAHAASTARSRVRYETFSAGILHSVHGESFGYVLLPAVAAAAMPAAAARWAAAGGPVLSNSDALQAVSDEGGPTAQIQAVFWATALDDGSPTTLRRIPLSVFGVDGASLSVSAPSVVLARRLNATSVIISASAVDRGGPLTLSLQGVSLRCSAGAEVGSGGGANGGVASTVTLAIPTDANLVGQSVSTVCKLTAVRMGHVV